VSDEVTSALGEIEVDRENLYREEIYTDLKVATIRVLTPVTSEGAPDLGRPTRFIAQTQLLSHAGPVPIQTQIDAATLDEAIRLFPEAVKQGVEALIEEARQVQRDDASRIVVPNVGPGGRIIS
jgi:hypothetical protein